MVEVRVFAPVAQQVTMTTTLPAARAFAEPLAVELRREGDEWVGDVSEGTLYQLWADGIGPLVDPLATQVWFGANHERRSSDAWAQAGSWPDARPQRSTTRPLVVYETHVRGFTKRRDRRDAGTFAALRDELPRLAELGVSVVELLPVHQYDPAEGNYWGYMPLVFGAIHCQYAASDRPADELAEMIAAAHNNDIEVWLDVVFNHTTEEDEHGPTFNLRGLANTDYYVVRDDGTYVDEAGTGNIVDATSPAAQRLIMASLDRLADLGVDGFRFDLAAVLTREESFVREIGDWAARRGVRLIAEPWDLARYQLGRAFPDQRWAQWNGKFRDDMRGFLRGEAGLIPTVIQRIQGSPDLFDRPLNSINFLTSHDGFTMYDLVAYDNKHNQANGWNNTDGTDDNRSWNCGWEGDDGADVAVHALRRRQMRNAMCLLALSHGTPMFVAGDEFARTQHGNNNPYNQDNETSWVDWNRRAAYVGHDTFVQRLLEFRSDHPGLSQREPWGTGIEWFGVDGPPDLEYHSRSLAWHLDGLYVMVNMWWEPLVFDIQAAPPAAAGRWNRLIDTATETGFVDRCPAGQQQFVGPRSSVVLGTCRGYVAAGWVRDDQGMSAPGAHRTLANSSRSGRDAIRTSRRSSSQQSTGGCRSRS